MRLPRGRLANLAFIVGSVLLVSCCFVAANVATRNAPRPTPVPVVAAPTVGPAAPPTPTVFTTATSVFADATATPVIASEPSKGLGMSRAAWEVKNGTPVKDGQFGGYWYTNGAQVSFIEDRAWRVDFWFPEGKRATPDSAHDTGKQFIPDDAELVRTYQRDETTVNLYRSAWLATRFGADSFVGGEPGEFTLQYNVYKGNEVHALIIGLGNNP